VTLDIAFKVCSLLIGLGIFGGIARLVTWAIRLEPRVELVEKQAESTGRMMQQLTATVSRIEGWLGGFSEWDGKTERRKLGSKL
jgi:hypothetical protein